ncbi:MAG TPA: hypothetical protein VFI11_10435 [Anaerolineales bacterium]|nr:hypothetical protein [Anaerolineales bacterium]
MKKPVKPRPDPLAAKGAPVFVPPYYPSWVDRLTQRIDRFPGPAWAFYLVTGLLAYLLISMVQWSAGTYPVGTFSRVHAVGAFLTPYALGLMHYLDESASASMKAFRPALRADESYPSLAYILTTLPPRAAWWSGIASVAVGLGLVLTAIVLLPHPASQAGGLAPLTVGFAHIFEVSPTPLSYAVTLALLVVNWFVGGALILHTVRRLTLVARLYRRHTNVDVFRQGPLYALSRLTAQTTIGAAVVLYGIASVPTYTEQLPGQVMVAAIALLAAASFASPLLGVHRVLATERDRLMEGISDRLRVAGDELHRRIDQRQYKGMDELHKAVAALEIERNMIAAMPTWPWQPDTFRWVLAAMILPVVIWVVQLLLERALTP